MSSPPKPTSVDSTTTPSKASGDPISARPAPVSIPTTKTTLTGRLSTGGVPLSPSKRRQVIVAVDDSECSLNAFAWAVQNLYKSGDYFTLLYVQPELRHISNMKNHNWHTMNEGMYVLV